MKTSEGKPINGKDVAIVLFQPLLKFGQSLALLQLPRRESAQPQSDGVGTRGANPFFNSQRVRFQRAESLPPRFAAMDVGAVSQMMTLRQSHLVMGAPLLLILILIIIGLGTSWYLLPS